MKKFNIIVAATAEGGISMNGVLPWKLRDDMIRFRMLTMGGTVIMGSKTWSSIPLNYRPLAGRKNIVLSSSELDVPKDVAVAKSLDEALSIAEGEIWIIGGARNYTEALKHPLLAQIYYTRVNHNYTCDNFIPILTNNEFITVEDSGKKLEKGISYNFLVLERRMITEEE